MGEQDQRLKVTTERNVTIAELVDRKLLDEVVVTEIGSSLKALVDKLATPRLLLDFSNVNHMSSSTLGMMITLHKRIRQKKGEFRLCSVRQDIHEIFVITRLNEILEIHPSRREALDSFS